MLRSSTASLEQAGFGHYIPPSPASWLLAAGEVLWRREGKARIEIQAVRGPRVLGVGATFPPMGPPRNDSFTLPGFDPTNLPGVMLASQSLGSCLIIPSCMLPDFL